MRNGLKLVMGTGILAIFSPGLFAATCTTWTLGNGTTTIAPGTSASGTSSGTIPCTLGSNTFSNFYVYNTATSDTDIVVGVSFTAPAVMTFGVTNLDSFTDFDAVFEVTPGQGSLTINTGAASAHIVDTVCSVQFINGQSCTGNGGVVLGSAIVNGSSTVTIPLANSPSGNDWVFEDVSGVTSFSKSFAVPEPVTLALVGAGLLALGLTRRWRRAS
jgi:Tfp pilus assembly protein PilW